MSSSAAEKIVKKLARLPSNTVCANCGTTKKFGFSTVCIKYFTFVCNNCKSSHQAISHRCKSLTMSSWTMEEAAELKKKGNDYARRTWLKNAPPVGQGGRPREGDPVDVFKRFVVDAYERKKYYGEDEGINGVPSGRAAHVTTAVPTARVVAPMMKAPVRKAVSPPAPPPTPPVADLLDFSSIPTATSRSGIVNNANTSNTFEVNFDTFAPVASMPESRPSTSAKPALTPMKNDPFQAGLSQTAVASNCSTSTFEADFDAFAPVASEQASRPSTDAKTFEAPIQNDPFQPNMTKKAATFDNSKFNFINKNNIMAAPSTVPQAPAPPAVKNVMNNHNLSQKSSLISSMCLPSPGNIPQGNHNMGMSMGWNSINNNMNQNSFGGLGNMQPLQQQMLMQQQQMNMMNGMCINNNNMRTGMMNNNNMMMGNMMMGNSNNSMMMSNSKNNSMMSNQRQAFMNGNNFGGVTNNTTVKSKDTMHSLQMNSSLMSAWSSGSNK